MEEKKGSKWTSQEEANLLEELKNNISITDIAINHKRGEGGINARIINLVYKIIYK